MRRYYVRYLSDTGRILITMSVDRKEEAQAIAERLKGQQAEVVEYRDCSCHEHREQSLTNTK
jgi:hypothetical protein